MKLMTRHKTRQSLCDCPPLLMRIRKVHLRLQHHVNVKETVELGDACARKAGYSCQDNCKCRSEKCSNREPELPQSTTDDAELETPQENVRIFLAHLVFYQTSLRNHDLSVMHSCWCHRHLCTALLATGFKIETSYLVWICTYAPNICTLNI